MRTYSQKGVLQESFTDLRDGRYVLPVRISAQNEIDGTLYETSVSKQTVFIEPKEIGRLKQQTEAPAKSPSRKSTVILEATSKKLLPYAQEITQGSIILINWDITQAKAQARVEILARQLQLRLKEGFFSKHTTHLYWAGPCAEANYSK
jgi:DNA mismatch repair protein MutS2